MRCLLRQQRPKRALRVEAVNVPKQRLAQISGEQFCFNDAATKLASPLWRVFDADRRQLRRCCTRRERRDQDRCNCGPGGWRAHHWRVPNVDQPLGHRRSCSQISYIQNIVDRPTRPPLGPGAPFRRVIGTSGGASPRRTVATSAEQGELRLESEPTSAIQECMATAGPGAIYRADSGCICGGARRGAGARLRGDAG